MDAQQKVSSAIARLVLDAPFFGATALKYPIKYGAVGTACITPRGRITIDPTFLDKLTVPQVQFLLAHECLHRMFIHAARKGTRNHSRWNWACDAVINETLIADNIGKFIDGGVRYEGAELMSAEQVFAAMPEPEDPEHPDMPIGGIGEDFGDGSEGGGDAEGELSAAELADIEAEAARDMVEARNLAKMAGNMPANMKRLIDSLINKRVPWHEVLSNIMTALVPQDVTWTRPNRRHVANDLYLPGTDKQPHLGHVVIAVDTSGSVSEGELREYVGHINDILEVCVPEKMSVVYCDYHIQHTDEYTADDLPLTGLEMHGGGGTRFTPVFDWVQENGHEPDVLIYMTDMDASYPEDEPPYPVVWLSTARWEIKQPKFGQVINIRG